MPRSEPVDATYTLPGLFEPMPNPPQTVSQTVSRDKFLSTYPLKGEFPPAPPARKPSPGRDSLGLTTHLCED